MDIVIEILLELYLELMLLIVPEEKRRKRHYVFATIGAIVVTFGVLALGVWGGYMLFKQNRTIGLIPFFIAILLSVIQIALGIVLFVRKNKN